MAEVSDVADTSDPIQLVQTFLRLMEARDLAAAVQLVAEDVVITFPGNRTFRSLEDQVASSEGRFHSVRKTFDGFDLCPDPARAEDESHRVTVYVFGTLSGKRLDHTPFDGVRFIDRFVIENGMIVDQQVWNDVAESGILAG